MCSSRASGVPILGGLGLILAVVMTGSVMVIGMIAAAIICMAGLVWVGGIRVLYAYAALIWLLPRIYLPGFDAIVPVHVLVVGGLAFLWCVGKLTEVRSSRAPSCRRSGP